MSRQINLTAKNFSDFGEFYSLVAGRCSGAVLHVTPEQAETLYHILASADEWKEPTILPADYRISSLQKIIVVED